MTVQEPNVVLRNQAELVLRRRLAELRHIADRVSKFKMSALQICAAIVENRLLDNNARTFFSGLPDDEKHYWVASLYALLMPKKRRRKLAAYFTPPYLAQYALDALVTAGVDLRRSRILDPACGGAAFLVPLAARLSREMRASGATPREIIERVETALEGIEIEPDLAALSQLLLSHRLQKELGVGAKAPKVRIQQANTLKCQQPELLYDAIIGNPPYGRILRPTKSTLATFKEVVSEGYVNLYGLFVEQAIRWVKPGGVICLVIPISFVGGPYFAALRRRVVEATDVLGLDPVDKRSDVFLDVVQDVCVLVLRKKGGTSNKKHRATCSLLRMGEPHEELGYLDLPESGSKRIWALPSGESDDFFAQGTATLNDYGYVTKTGYFVWNREKERYREGWKAKKGEVPLIWAHNIRPGVTCLPRVGSQGDAKIGFVKISGESSAIIHTDAIVLQRTSNRRQVRRLIAGTVRAAQIPGKLGFVTENHTVLVLPDPNKKQGLSIAKLCRLLNSKPVDDRFRRMSGSVSISTKGLRDLPLPQPDQVRKALATSVGDDEAIAAAYKASFTPTSTRKRK